MFLCEILDALVDHPCLQLQSNPHITPPITPPTTPPTTVQGVIKHRWILSNKERKHSHDVRALAVLPTGHLVSAGALVLPMRASDV